MMKYGWHSVKDGQMPSSNQEIQIACRDGSVLAARYYREQLLFCATPDYKIPESRVTHWAPLLDAPKSPPSEVDVLKAQIARLEEHLGVQARIIELLRRESKNTCWLRRTARQAAYEAMEKVVTDG